MSYARRDDRHNEDLVNEIAEGFARTIKERKEGKEGKEGKQGTDKPAGPGFTITGDARTAPKPRRRDG